MDQNFSVKDFNLPDINQQSPLGYIDVHVNIDPTVQADVNYADSFYDELVRQNDHLVETVEISRQELNSYFSDLIYLRVLDSNRNAGMFHKYLSSLFMPSWMQFALSQIGQVTDEAYGLNFIPVMAEREIDIDALIDTSSKLAHFKHAGMELFDRAFPRSVEGSKDFMTMAVIHDTIVSYRSDNDPLSTYLVAFLGSTVKELDALNGLYRIRYQDVAYVERVLKTMGGLMK